MVYEMFSDTFKLMEYALNLHSRQNSLIASNLANYETPGYKPLRIDFEASMQKALEKIENQNSLTGAARHGESVRGYDVDEIVMMARDENSIMRQDGNSVSLEHEIARLEQNTLLYSVTARILGQRFNQLKMLLENERRV